MTHPMHAGDSLSSIPPEYRENAEHVRAHLVHLRGGAPFLSPADALRLVTWFDDGVSVAAILAALDRCVISRRSNNARTRLTLTAAGRHLGKPPLRDPGFTRQADAPPFLPVATALRDLDDPEAHALAEELAALPEDDPERLVTTAVAVSRARHDRRWSGQTDAEREARIERAIAELGDLANLVDADTLRMLAEESARDAFRREWPPLDTATFQILVSA